MTDEERASYEALKAEFEQLEHEYAEADELPDEVDARLCELETLIESFEQRPVRFEPEDIARAGVFVSLDAEGELDIERGFVRPEDKASASGSDGEAEGRDSDAVREDHPTSAVRASEIGVAGDVDSSSAERLDEDEVVRPLSDRLVMELTAHRTLALRDAVAGNLDVAFLSILHALCLCAFYRYSSATCLEITAKSSGFTAQAPGLKDSASSKSITERHERWQRQLPDKPEDLWATLRSFDADSRSDLFAHCASLSVNAVCEPWARDEARLRHIDELARAVQLDMAAAGWSATSDNYLGRVSKARILEAVREAKGEASAQLIDHLKKVDMAREAERLLEGAGWLPEPLRAPNDDEAQVEISENSHGEAVDLPEFLEGDEEADAPSDDDGAQTPPEHRIAAD